VLQRVVDRALLGLALVLVEIGLQLKLGFVLVQQEFLPGPKRESADIAKRYAGRAPDESNNFETSVWHGYIMASCSYGVNR
jgi:hypothetical protein